MPAYTLKRIFQFEAAHTLPALPDGHKCRNLHGHNYKAEITIRGDTSKHSGMVIDFADIDKVWESECSELDHAYLNDIPDLEQPTAEWIASWIKHRFKARGMWVSVTVWENDRSSATVH